MKKLIGLMMLMLALLAIPALAMKNTAPSNIVETAVATNTQGPYAGSFDILIAALQAEGDLIKRLQSKQRFTVFAPTDAAFESLFKELNVTAQQVLADKALLKKVLSYHVKRGSLDSDVVTSSSKLRMLSSDKIKIDGTVLTDENGRDANIIVADVKSGNGYIHVIDRVILPR